MVDFYKSDAGAQAAWKGFSSQTLYIASRLISDEGGYEYYPEDIEDLVVKKNGAVVEAVQVKNISADLTLSSLASRLVSRLLSSIFSFRIYASTALNTRNARAAFKRQSFCIIYFNVYIYLHCTIMYIISFINILLKYYRNIPHWPISLFLQYLLSLLI